MGLERLEHGGPHALGGHDVGLTGDPVALAVAGERDAAPPGMHRQRPLGVHDGHLARGGKGVLGQQGHQRGRGIGSLGHQLQRQRPVGDLTLACVATAPTPARAQGTIGPTENQCDCTATPSSPVRGSRATIEYVPWRPRVAVSIGATMR